jgi:hypothetical protein
MEGLAESVAHAILWQSRTESSRGPASLSELDNVRMVICLFSSWFFSCIEIYSVYVV